MLTLPQYTLTKRPRRNRKLHAIRNLIQETILTPQDLIVPFFVISGEGSKESIQAMPGVDRLTIDLLIKEAENLHKQGIMAIALFPVIPSQQKDDHGNEALNGKGLIPQAIRMLKQKIPSLCVIADVALDPYTTHGHDGVLNEYGEVDNDLSLAILQKQALVYADAGCDIVAPSDMMDGRIKIIREELDKQGFTNTSLLSYAAKYASSFYAPFRSALQSHLSSGDKTSYQINPANKREAFLEAQLDEEEGADMLLVKPALSTLDVLAKIREKTHLPIGAYHVSGEYAMIMAAHEKGFLDAKKAFYETLISIKRAGADFIFTYAAKLILEFLN